VKQALDSVSRSEIDGFMKLLAEALETGRTIFVMGNGGSGATASHFAADFNKGISYGKAKRFRFVCLNDNVPTLTAYANDLGYEEVFVEQLRNFLSPGDLVIGISGSGNSPNILKAIEYANGMGAKTVGLTGYDGGKLRRLAGCGVNIPIDNMQVAEDLHMMLDHLVYSVFTHYLPNL
jgi:D-sedoheptulose 7-phosphate isomerase